MNAPELSRGALISACGKYRFWLWREWADFAKPMVAYCGLNPSTADGEAEDATTRRWKQFAEDGGCSGYVAVNLSPQRSTDPRALLPVPAHVVDLNDHYVRWAALHAQRFIVCWGGYSRSRSSLDWLHRREKRILEIVRSVGKEPYCLGVNPTSGTPCHPLYLKRDTPLELYKPEEIR